MTIQEKNRLKVQIQRAIRDPDEFSLHFIYVTDDKVSIRVVSPYRWEGGDCFVGLCMSRQNHRSFCVERIHKLRVVKSSEVSMPYPVQELEVSRSRRLPQDSPL